MDFCVFCWGLCAAVTGWVGDAEMREEGCREERSLVKVMAGDQDQGLESKQSWSGFNEMLRPKSWQQVVQKWNEGLSLWMMEPEDSGRLDLLMHTFCPRLLLVSACDGPVPAAGSQWATWKREKVISGSMPVCKGATFASLTLI